MSRFWSRLIPFSGLALFFGLPELGYSGTETRTAVFLYESLAQLAFVYPARLITSRPAPNRLLNSIVAATVALQAATVALPFLRTILGLEPLDRDAYAIIAATLGISVLGAFLSARVSRGRTHTPAPLPAGTRLGVRPSG